MTKLRLSTDLTLPLDAATQTIAVLGLRGSGKTTTAAVIAEELLTVGVQVVIIDPTDSWWGLKSSADGQKAGFPVTVFGGKHKDIDLSSADGKVLADFVVEQGASVICSLRHFESKSQELTFVTAFLRRLYFLKGQQDAPTPLALILDEASRLVPQRVMGEEASCVGAVQQIVRQGRSSGFGVMLIDQRASTVNKDVLDMLEMLVMHRTTGPRDRKALRDWIEAHDSEGREKEFLASLASLRQGEAWFWSPGWLDLFQRVQVRQRKTFDSSRTPRVGEIIAAPKKVAQVDLDALKVKFAASIEKTKAEDPKELQKTIRERDAEIARMKKSVPLPVTDERAIERAVAAERKAADLRGAAMERAMTRAANVLVSAGNTLLDEGARLIAAKDQISADSRAQVQVGNESASSRRATTGANHPADLAMGRGTQAPARPIATPQPRAVRAAPAEGSLGKTPQRMLNALRFLETVGTSPASRAAVAGLVSVSWDTGTFRNYLSELRAAGYINDGPGTNVSLTDAGRAAASEDGLPTTQAELHATWMSKLGGTPQRMFAVMLEQYPDGVTRKQLGEACGIDHTTGTFRNYLSEIRSPGLMIDVDKATVRAADALFPAGLRA